MQKLINPDLQLLHNKIVSKFESVLQIESFRKKNKTHLINFSKCKMLLSNLLRVINIHFQPITVKK